VFLLVQRNHIMFMPMSATQEYAAMKAIRQFLLDFADVIYFSYEGWCRVLLVLHCDEVQDKFVTNRERRAKAGVKEPVRAKRTRIHVYQGDEEEEGSAYKLSRKALNSVRLKDTYLPGGVLYKNGPYSSEGKEGKFVVRIPHDFKRKQLIEFLGDALPCSRAPHYEPYLALQNAPLP
jgi:hypothetical protein